MLLEEPLRPWLESMGVGKNELVLLSLGVIAVILGATVMISVVTGPKEVLEHLSEELGEIADPQATAATNPSNATSEQLPRHP